MLNLLSAATSQFVANIASIIVSALLSTVLIVVTIKIARRNNELEKQSIYLPIRLEICKAVMHYSNKFYDACSKLITHRSIVDEKYFQESIDKLDDMNTDLYEITIRVKSIFPQEKEFYECLNDLFIEADNLPDQMIQHKLEIVADMPNFDQQTKLFTYNNLMLDVINIDQNYKILTNSLHIEMIRFLDLYKKVYNIMDKKINYTSFIQSKQY